MWYSKNRKIYINSTFVCVIGMDLEFVIGAHCTSNTLSHRCFFCACAFVLHLSRSLGRVHFHWFNYIFVFISVPFVLLLFIRISICGKHRSIAHKFTSNYSKLTSLCLAHVSYLPIHLLPFSRPVAAAAAAASAIDSLSWDLHSNTRCRSMFKQRHLRAGWRGGHTAASAAAEEKEIKSHRFQTKICDAKYERPITFDGVLWLGVFVRRCTITLYLS